MKKSTATRTRSSVIDQQLTAAKRARRTPDLKAIAKAVVTAKLASAKDAAKVLNQVRQRARWMRKGMHKGVFAKHAK